MCVVTVCGQCGATVTLPSVHLGGAFPPSTSTWSPSCPGAWPSPVRIPFLNNKLPKRHSSTVLLDFKHSRWSLSGNYSDSNMLTLARDGYSAPVVHSSTVNNPNQSPPVSSPRRSPAHRAPQTPPAQRRTCHKAHRVSNTTPPFQSPWPARQPGKGRKRGTLTRSTVSSRTAPRPSAQSRQPPARAGAGAPAPFPTP